MTSLAASAPSSTTAEDPAGRIAALFDAHCDFVCRVLRQLGVHEAALDDAVQDVFVTAHRRWSSFEGRSSPRSWLYGIARRIASRYRRSADARARRLVPSDDAAPEAGEDPFDRVHAADSLAALLHGLDADKRAVFVLTEIEGMTAPEVAEALGIPLGTAYSRLRAAWQVLAREAGRERLRGALPSMRAPGPAPERRQRMWGLVAGGIAIPTAKIVPPAASTGWLAQAKWMVVGAALGAGLLGARAAVVATTRADAPAQPRAAVMPAAPSRPPSMAAIDPPAPEPGVSPTPARVPAAETLPPTTTPTPRRKPAVVSPEPAEDSLTAELALLQRARQALRDGRPTDALTVLEEHARRFARGQLADERRAMRIQAVDAGGVEHGGP